MELNFNIRLVKCTLLANLGLLIVSFTIENNSEENSKSFKIQWIENLEGNFDFRYQWSYPEGIYRNEFGQLSCDGLCPEEAEAMKDSEGRIYADSLQKYYQLVDTAHHYHSLQCEAWCYEWAGADYIKAESVDDKIRCYSLTNSATHCSLVLEVSGDLCYAYIELNSVSSNDIKIYKGESGILKIDKTLWKQNFIKAEFSFDFDNGENPEQVIFWKGKIYAAIEKK